MQSKSTNNVKRFLKISPIEFFNKLQKSEKQVCFLNSHSKNGWTSMIGWNPVDVYVGKKWGRCKPSLAPAQARACTYPNVDVSLRNFIQKQNSLDRKLVGYFAYDLGYKLHDIKQTKKSKINQPNIYIAAFDNYVIFDERSMDVYYSKNNFVKEVQGILDRLGGFEPSLEPVRARARTHPCAKFNLSPTITAKQYNKAYNKIKKYIKAGDVYQINLTYQLAGKTALDSRALFQKIIASNQVDFQSYIETKGFEILSASPERFIKIKKSRIETCPIKGTRPRGKTALIDKKNKQELLNSAKEAAELNMITDLLRNDLGKICQIGSVKVEKQRAIMTCPTVWHTYSKIFGKLKKNVSPIDALLSMFPGGSVTGCPKKRAMEIIDELEMRARGIYTGTIFTIDPDGALDSSIIIRTVLKKGDDIYLDVGGGIVYDSEAKAEFKETLDKAGSFL